jgi:hypothetical protein
MPVHEYARTERAVPVGGVVVDQVVIARTDDIVAEYRTALLRQRRRQD